VRPRIGILVGDLSPSHLNWRLLNSANSLAKGGKVDVAVFYEALSRPCVPPEVAVLPSCHAAGFAGVLVATSLVTAARLRDLPAAAAKLFYCWDLEWCRVPDKAYARLAPLYRSARLRLVARTAEHAKLLSQLWNRPVRDVVPEAEVGALLGVGLDA
jgi:hypothetical protein